jgi:hypothetical protein
MLEQTAAKQGKQATASTTADDLLRISRELAIAEIERFYLASQPLSFESTTSSSDRSGQPKETR